MFARGSFAAALTSRVVEGADPYRILFLFYHIVNGRRQEGEYTEKGL